MSTRGSQPAYPHVCKVVEFHPDGSMISQPITQGGMTKRELFAAMAMQGLLASHEAGRSPDFEITAIWATAQADALLRKLEENNVP